MRQLTFSSFLEDYLIEYSGLNSLSIHKLYNKSKKDARLRELLFLFCCYTNKIGILNKYSNKNLFKEYPYYSKEMIDEELLNVSNDRYYSRIFNTYLNIINKKEYDNKYKLMLLEDIKRLMKEKQISTYKVYSRLHLNPGNINDFFKHSNPDKVSVATCKQIYSFVNSL